MIADEEKHEKEDDGKKEKNEVIKTTLSPLKPPVPYPSNFRGLSKINSMLKFLDLFKQLHINLPFFDAFMQSSMYVKFHYGRKPYV